MSSSGEGWRLELGAGIVPAGGVFFRVWAPWANKVSAIILSRGEREIRLEREDTGYFSGRAEGGSAGDRYLYRIDDNRQYPDPAEFSLSRYSLALYRRSGKGV
jgi:maltooligosyltrehalose trehalohydrolase